MSEEKNLPQQETQEEVNEQIRVRREKLAALQADGRDPFTLTSYPVDHYAAGIKEQYASPEPEQETGVTVCIAGG